MENLKGRLSIGQVTCHGEGAGREKFVSISLEDESSGLRLACVEVDLAVFAEALFGLGNVPVIFNVLSDVSRVGKKLEVKSVKVRIPKNIDNIKGHIRRQKLAQDIAGQFEVDGWEADKVEYDNYHRITFDGDDKLVETTFRRWV